jgi:hypothetical protein
MMSREMHEYIAKTKNSSSLAPLGGEGEPHGGG